MSTQVRNQQIDLGQGKFSNVGATQGNNSAGSNLSIAFNTVIENAIGGSGNDILVGNGAANQLTGGAGADIIDGGAGDDIINGGDGFDTASYASSAAGVTVNLATNAHSGGDAAGDMLTSIEAVIGSAFADIITGGASDDTLSGGAGNDVLNGAGGTNILAGGANDDRYIVNQGNVTINEAVGEGIDLVQTNRTSHFLSANVDNLTYTGNAGFFGVGNIIDNLIIGGVGVDQLEGRDGNDTLNDGGGAGADALFGGTGNDVYIVRNIGSSTIESVGQGSDEVRTTFFIYGLQSNIENLTYSDNAQHGAGVGNTLDNVITGGTGIDDLFGREGNDTLRGGSGAANTLLGQEGDDTYIVTAVGDSIIEFVGQGTDTVQTALASLVLRDHVENLTYTGAATFTGIGASGANTLTGGALDDFLSGLDGADILVGKSGADFLLGGAGSDQYRYEGGEAGFDRITDFVSGVDKIALRDAGFAQTASFVLAQGGTPIATTTNSTFLYNINTGLLSFDVDGSGAGAAITLAQLNGGLTLAVGDFVFY